ncbi:hypothetical protein MMC13_005098 [Lambiella insularis]|nr:hypothetical protein [Lambiella insularis]
MTTSPTKTYHGNCHCAAFKFTLEVPEIQSAMSCNCTICSRKGYLWLYPDPAAFQIERGDRTLTEYQFGNKAFTHKFCPTCGIPVMAVMNSSGVVAVNVRTLRDFDVWAIDPYPNPTPAYDGAALPSPYEVPTYTGPDIRTEKEKGELKLYTGGCHCGAVTLAVKSAPIEEILVNEDDCSICIRNANLLIYPPTSHVAIHGSEHLSAYQFEQRSADHKFCRTCGVSVCIVPLGLDMAAKRNWSPETLENITKAQGRTTINIRNLEGVDVKNVQRTRDLASTYGEPYVVT